MPEQRLPLSSLSRGDRFLGGDGQHWTVLKNEAGFMTAIRQGRPAFTARLTPPNEPLAETDMVVVTNRDDDGEMTEALAAVSAVFDNAELISSVPIQVAAQYASIHEIRSHIHLLHGEYAGDIRTSKALSAAHAEMHAEGHMKVPHTHGQTGE